MKKNLKVIKGNIKKLNELIKPLQDGTKYDIEFKRLQKEEKD